MEDKIRAIHEALWEINEKYQKERERIQDNRDAAIKLVHFVSDTIENVAPREINAVWMGSYKNPNVGGYPWVTIYARLVRKSKDIAEWTINTSGQTAPPKITQADILNIIQRGLNEVNKDER